MADVNIREAFPTLENADAEGKVLAVAIDGATAASGLNGSIGFAFKDSSGNVVLPQLTADGKIAVDTEGFGGTKKSAAGTIIGVLNTPTVVATITGLTVSTSCELLHVSVACTQTTLWTVVATDNATPATLAYLITGPGQFTMAINPDMPFVTGSTGTQKIEVKGSQLSGKESDLHANITVKELAAS